MCVCVCVCACIVHGRLVYYVMSVRVTVRFGILFETLEIIFRPTQEKVMIIMSENKLKKRPQLRTRVVIPKCTMHLYVSRRIRSCIYYKSITHYMHTSRCLLIRKSLIIITVSFHYYCTPAALSY